MKSQAQPASEASVGGERSEPTTNGLKGSCWSITINNPSAADEQDIALLQTKKWFKKWEGQIEQGEKESTPHIQGCLHTEYIRWAAVKKVLRRAHIEKARNQMALVDYVHKPNTRTAELQTVVRVGPAEVEKHIYQRIIRILQSESRGNSVWSERYVCDVLIGSEVNGDLQRAFRGLDAMSIFDDVVSELIAEGAQLEMWASNPLVRSGIKKYFHAIVIRNVRAHTQREDVDGSAGSGTQEDSQSHASSEADSID